MKKIISVLKRQDLMNLLLLVAGFALCIVSIFMKQAQVGLIFLAIICALVISRSNNRRKRMSRMFGALYFHMPDGEIYPMTYEQMKSEYVHGQQSKYAGRRVTVKFMYSGLDENGDIDTGFGLRIRAEEKYLQDWKKGQIWAATGRIAAKRRDYFMIGEVEEIRLSTQKEDLTVSDEPKTEDHTKQEE